MKIRRLPRRSARIEMLPLIDIVFLLLVFFIYAMLSMAVHNGLHLDLPESSQAERNEEPKLSLYVRIIDGELNVYSDERKIELSDIPMEVAKISDGRKAGVLLFAEKQVSYQEFYRVLDELKRGGVHDVSLQANRQ